MKNLIKTLFIILFCEPSKEELKELKAFLDAYDEYMKECKFMHMKPEMGFCRMLNLYSVFSGRILHNAFINIFRPSKYTNGGYWFHPDDWTKRHEIVKCVRMIYNHHKD